MKFLTQALIIFLGMPNFENSKSPHQQLQNLPGKAQNLKLKTAIIKLIFR